MSLQDISKLINVVPNFPKQGIFFRDISPLLASPDKFNNAVDMLYDLIKDLEIDYVAGIESRGFIFGLPLAQKLGKGFVMLRKPNKMPNTLQVKYGLEYGEDILTIQTNLIPQGKSVLIVDDLLATAGSLVGACELIEKIGCRVAGCICLIELTGIPRKEKFSSYKFYSLIKYPANSPDKFISKTDEMLLTKRVRYLPITNSSVDDDRIVVFSHPSTESFAFNIVASSPHFRHGTIQWRSFPDGYPNVTFEELKYLENTRVVFVASLYNIERALEQLSMMMVLPKQFIKSFDIVLAYFAPGTMERVDKEGILATAHTTAAILSSCLTPTKSGNPIIHIYDLHAVVERFYFSNNVTVRMQSAIPLLKDKISPNTTTIVFPDQGAYKRFGHEFVPFGYKTIVCSKIRIDDKRRIIQITDKINWPEDESKCYDDVLIVDDIVQSGGTLEECRKRLEELNCKKISAYVTHAVFPNRGYKKFLTSNGGKFEKFYITNTVPNVANALVGQQPFEIIELEDHIAQELLTSCEYPKLPVTKPQQYDVYVASANDTKMNAVYTAVSDLLTSKFGNNYKLNVFGVNVPSDVPEQPLHEQTQTGCSNRLENLKKWITHHDRKYDMLVSIENGITWESRTDPKVINKPYDLCVAGIKSSNNTFGFFESQFVSTEKVNVPADLVTMSMSDNQSVTVGSMIEKKFGYPTGHWHEKVCGKTRHQIIKETIVNNMEESVEKVA